MFLLLFLHLRVYMQFFICMQTKYLFIFSNIPPLMNFFIFLYAKNIQKTRMHYIVLNIIHNSFYLFLFFLHQAFAAPAFPAAFAGAYCYRCCSSYAAAANARHRAAHADTNSPSLLHANTKVAIKMHYTSWCLLRTVTNKRAKGILYLRSLVNYTKTNKMKGRRINKLICNYKVNN